MQDKFTIEMGEERFVVRKLYEDDKDFSLYILPYDPAYKGFFMTRNEEGEWKIVNKMLVSIYMVAKEADIADALVKQLL